MVATPSRTQSITMYTNRQIMQPTLGFRLKISTSEVRIKGVMQTLHRIWRRCCRRVRKHRKAREGTREVHQTEDSSDSMKTRCSNTVIRGGSETLKVRRKPNHE